MEQFDQEKIMAFTDTLSQPAFAVKDGLVCYANAAFSAFQIGVGTPLHSFFGADEPFNTEAEFACTVAGISCKARIFPQVDCAFYILRQQEQTVSVHALAHSVKSIRSSLHGMYNALAGLSDFVESAESEPYQTSFNGILQGIYRLERTAQNLDLLQKLSCGSYAFDPEQTDMVGCLSAILEHAKDLLLYAGIRLEYELPEKLFNGNLDRTLFEAVFWNALSNAAANTKNGTVCVTAAHRGNFLQLTFRSGGTLLAQPKLFARYQRAVDELPANSGSGFGLSVIRMAAERHGGTVLFSEKPGEEVAFMVTLDLTRPVTANVRSPLPVEATLSKGLVHLSELLPREAYDSRDIL